ncbi:MAG: tRNA guanosine(34) transglycosylase Tgt [Planctomycetes bacterium]|nr:tRNA guanosine(34) transglycosylase Tgt [Planctomycetota bacterium]
MHFELLHTDASGARRSRFRTEHGVVECPAFMPVGTQAAVKAMTPDQVEATGAQVVLANTYHLSYDGRRELISRLGGLHTAMAWPHTILTDSGGFQVFSIPDKQIGESGVAFKDPKTGADLFLDPETSMAIQKDLSSDIVMAFDECVEYPATKDYVAASLERTTRWAERCRACELADHQYLFGIVQGGTWQDLRERSAEQITAIDFDGFAIGGVSVGEGSDLMKSVTEWAAPLLPAHLPRYLMGVGLPEDILEAVERGVDMFDCVIPTRYARSGTLFTRTGRIRIGDKKFRKDKFAPDTRCGCYTCKNYSRAMLRHLHYAGEPIFATLASIHNIAFYQELMADIRAAIETGRFAEVKAARLAGMDKGSGKSR